MTNLSTRVSGGAHAPIPESQFPTIRSFSEALARLVEEGFGDFPAQIMIVPDSTIQAIAQSSGHSADAKPALMIDMDTPEHRMPTSLISAVWITGKKMPTTRSQ